MRLFLRYHDRQTLILRSPRSGRLEGCRPQTGPHGSPGDAKHRPETRFALLTMRSDAVRLARRHFRADLGAHLVDQPQAILGLDMPEGPAVAGAGALRHRADAVDRADLVAEHDGAVGANQRAMALFGVDQPGAGRN